ncbi:hypothetical protein LLH23_17350 [bacterium]|nr:hypothetical protein [bacterium]
MRSVLVICCLVAFLSAACAAGGSGPTPVKRPGLSATALRTLQGGLSLTARQGLAGTITREQQLAVLRTDPLLSKRLAGLGAAAMTQPMGGDAWSTGIALTPVSYLYPANATYDSFALCLQTRAAWLSPFNPLPSAAQNPPLLWLNVAANSDPLFWVEAKWPSPGAYLITFFLKDLWPNSTAKPRVFHDGYGMQTPVANTPTGGDQWTFLWDASNPQRQHQEIGLYPAESGFGFTCCCLSKVVIRKL